MFKSTLQSLLSASLVTLAVGCSPQDKSLKPAGVGGGSVNPQNASNARGDSDKQMALLIDRVGEATQLIQAVVDSEFAEKRQIKVETETNPDVTNTNAGLVASGDATIPDYVFKNITIDKQQDSEEKQLSQKMQLTARLELDLDKSVKKIQIIDSNKSPRTERFVLKNKDKNKQKDVSLKNHKMNISAIKLENSIGYSVKVYSLDLINLKVGKSISESGISFNLIPESEGSKIFKIVQLKLQQDRIGQSTDNFEIVNTDAALTIELKDQCNELSGSLKMVSVAKKKDTGAPVYTRDISVTPELVSVSSGPNKTSMMTQKCEERPAVDLSKIL